MMPVSDEMEVVVRVLSSSIKQYMRTGSNSRSLTKMSVRCPPWAECCEIIIAK